MIDFPVLIRALREVLRWRLSQIARASSGNAGAVDRDGAEDRRHGFSVPKRQHAFDLALRLLRAGPVGLVDDEDIGDLHDAGFDGLNIVAHAGDQHDHRDVGERRDIDFILPHADRLDDDEVESGGAEQARERGAGARESAGCAARGHGADEDAGIGVMALHADAVAEDRAARGAAGGIDRDDRDCLPAAAHLRGQRVDQRTLARAREGR